MRQSLGEIGKESRMDIVVKVFVGIRKNLPVIAKDTESKTTNIKPFFGKPIRILMFGPNLLS